MAKKLSSTTTVSLDEPIKRGETTITEVVLRKPASGELRGLTLVDLLNGDVNALIRLLPRISQPSLTEQEVASLEPCDLVECGDAVALFLRKKSVREQLSQGE
jgi:hypothetical protein